MTNPTEPVRYGPSEHNPPKRRPTSQEIDEMVKADLRQLEKEHAAELKAHALGFSKFIGNRPLPEYSESTDLWRWWDNDFVMYRTATTEQLYTEYLNQK
jgi:hypothetical protein